MKTSSRILIGFGIGIALLVIVAFILVFTVGRSSSFILSESIPEGVVQHYLSAVQAKNYPLAYSYLAPPGSSDINGTAQTYDNWLMSAQNAGNSTWKANLGKVDITGDTASVAVTIDTFRSGGFLGNPVSTNNMTFLLRHIGTKWLINSPPDLYWLY